MEQAIRSAYDAHRDFDQKAFRAGCYAPFVSLDFIPTGQVQVCCKNWSHTLGDITEQRLDEIWNGGKIAALRNALTDYNFDSGCKLCEWQIARGDYETTTTTMYEKYPVDSATPEWPQIMGFALSNTCNYECIMRTGNLSSSIRARREGLPPLPKVYSDQFFEDLRRYLPHLRRAMFYGGEPFLTQECFRVWDMMLEDGLTTPCHVTTNASRYNDKIERILDALPVSLSISMDGATKETMEKVRVNCKYEEYLQNVHRFRDFSRRRGSHMNISFCLMRQNWRELADVLLLAEDLECTVFVNVVVTPKHCDLHTLPAAELSRIVDEMQGQESRLRGKLRLNHKVWDEQIQFLRATLMAPPAGAETLTQIRNAVSEEGPFLKLLLSRAFAGHFSEVVEAISKIDETHPDYIGCLFLRGYLGIRTGNLEQSEADLNLAVHLSELPFLPLLTRGILRGEQRRFDEAFEDVLRASKFARGHEERYEVLVLQGHLRRLTGDCEQAEGFLNEAIQLWWKPTEALIERASLRCSQKRFQEGVADALRACEMCDDNVVLQGDAQKVLNQLREERSRTK